MSSVICPSSGHVSTVQAGSRRFVTLQIVAFFTCPLLTFVYVVCSITTLVRAAHPLKPEIANTDDFSNLLASAALDGGSQVIMFILVSLASHYYEIYTCAHDILFFQSFAVFGASGNAVDFPNWFVVIPFKLPSQQLN